MIKLFFVSVAVSAAMFWTRKTFLDQLRYLFGQSTGGLYTWHNKFWWLLPHFRFLLRYIYLINYYLCAIGLLF